MVTMGVDVPGVTYAPGSRVRATTIPVNGATIVAFWSPICWFCSAAAAEFAIADCVCTCDCAARICCCCAVTCARDCTTWASATLICARA